MGRMRIGVIGGGAAGMTAAIAAAGEGAAVTLLEGGERVGKKILSTGNGKCNLGNLELSADAYYGADREWIADCLARFGSEDTIRFFRGMGLLVKERNGLLYPLAEQASVVLDALRWELRAMGVETVLECRVDAVRRNAEKGFKVSAGQRDFEFDRVILACGSKAAPKTGSDGSGYLLAESLGHAVVLVMPALVQLRCREAWLREVSGVRAEAVIRELSGEWGVIEERGELQLTDYGISGIPVFQMSRRINALLRKRGKGSEAELSVNLLPDYSAEEFGRLCAGRRLLQADRTAEEFFTGILNKKLMLLFMKLSGIRRDTPISQVESGRIDQVFGLCRDWRLHVTGSNSYDNAQVCAGGVDTAQVGRNMESLLVPGLFFAGEILDVDGRCGGYNLQWAWCSGHLAGRAAGRRPES